MDSFIYLTSTDTGEKIPINWKDITDFRKHGNHLLIELSHYRENEKTSVEIGVYESIEEINEMIGNPILGGEDDGEEF